MSTLIYYHLGFCFMRNKWYGMKVSPIYSLFLLIIAIVFIVLFPSYVDLKSNNFPLHLLLLSMVFIMNFYWFINSYFIFLSVRLNRLKNKLLANYLRNRGNDLATVRNSAFCVAILSNNSFICKYNIFFRKYELSVAILKIGLRKKKIIHPIHEIMLCNK